MSKRTIDVVQAIEEIKDILAMADAGFVAEIYAKVVGGAAVESDAEHIEIEDEAPSPAPGTVALLQRQLDRADGSLEIRVTADGLTYHSVAGAFVTEWHGPDGSAHAVCQLEIFPDAKE